MKKILMIAALIGVAGCQPATETNTTAVASGGTNVPGASVIWLASAGNRNHAYKFCDAGRAVYVIDGYGEATSVAVVASAPECAQ